MNKIIIISFDTLAAENSTLRRRLFVWQVLACVLFAFLAIAVVVLFTACGGKLE